MIRALHPETDREAVADLYRRAADYVVLEQGIQPTPEMVDAFFTDAPPGADLAQSLKLGDFLDGVLVAIADAGFGFPEPDDAYIGLMLIDPAARGRGRGSAFLRRIEAEARGRKALRLLLAVLDDNPRARAFWEREGFHLERSFAAAPLGERIHVRHRLSKAL